MSGNPAITARRVPCPTCGAPRFEYCIGDGGEVTIRSHPARAIASRAEPSITPAQVETLRRLYADPTRHIEPIVRQTLLRRGLIVALDPPVGPQTFRRMKRPKRRFLVTESGRAVLGVVLVEEVRAS